MRYIIKGGVWKNSEDEILKAAVMKYGLNQWSRISSLLVRKSAKQCKQRWYEWLDPSIKKTEWTREEQEKLLHLAKIFPSQWRTIAPIVGRTPMQCVEQYEKLLDLVNVLPIKKAQNKDLNDPNDPRRLRPGEIDPNPETKPARPDPIDMDEDEKEMLAEARVRLANTKGKKAKRKARGKLIEEARRLALLQKKRELKAAGIQYINHRIEKHHIKLQDRKYKGINYNRELAFERMVPDFVHATGVEEEPEPDKKIANVSLQTLEGQRRDEEEEIRRRVDQRRIKKLKERELDQAVQFQNKYQVKFQPQTKLVLPEPQLKDQDLELLGKINAVNEISEHTTNATRALVGNYSTREQNASIMRTPRAPNTVLREAHNIIALQHTETPLVGGANLPILSSDPSTNIVSQTPNQLASLLRTPNVLGRQFTENQPNLQQSRQIYSQEHQTPIHDAFKLNLEEYERNWEDQSSQARHAELERQIQLRNEQKLKQELQLGLKNLAQPKNEFNIEIPSLQEELLEIMEMELDAEDQVRIKKQLKQSEQLKKFKQKSSAFQKNLPPPKELPQGSLYEKTGNETRDEIEGLLSYQVVQLIKEDIYENGGLGDIQESSKILREEIDLLYQRMLKNPNPDKTIEIWNYIRDQCYYDQQELKFVQLDTLPRDKKLQIMKERLSATAKLFGKLELKQNSNINRLGKWMKGYNMKNSSTEIEIATLNEQINVLELNREVYHSSLLHERNIYKNRIREASGFLDLLVIKNNELQRKHASLLEELNEQENTPGLFEM